MAELEEVVDKSVKTNITPVQEEVMKSLSAGYGITPETQTDGGALKVESLDPQIKTLTYGQDDFTIYPDLLQMGTMKANSTVEKYVLFTNHGRIGHSRFQPEIGIGDINTPKMKQKTVNMKYIVDLKQQSMAINFATTIEDARKVNEEDAMTVIGKTIEWAVFYGDADLTSGNKGDGLEFDGLAKLIDKHNHINLHGQSLTPEVLNKAAVLIGKGFGVATDAYMPIGVKADFSNQFLGAQRVVMPTNDGYTAGVNVDRFLSARGAIRLNGSTIMDVDNMLDLDSAPNPQAPAQVSVATPVVVPDAGGEFLDEIKDAQGNVIQAKEIGVEQKYRVVATGDHGDGLPSDEVSATPTKATDGIKLTITLPAMQRQVPDYVGIYRQDPNTEVFYLIGRVAINEMDDEGNIVFTDTNAVIPGTADVFVGEMKKPTITLMEFIPISLLQLAVVTNATQFAVLWGGALRLAIPKRWVQIHNVRYNLYTDNSENHMLGLNTSGYFANTKG